MIVHTRMIYYILSTIILSLLSEHVGIRSFKIFEISKRNASRYYIRSTILYIYITVSYIFVQIIYLHYCNNYLKLWFTWNWYGHRTRTDNEQLITNIMTLWTLSQLSVSKGFPKQDRIHLNLKLLKQVTLINDWIYCQLHDALTISTFSEFLNDFGRNCVNREWTKRCVKIVSWCIFNLQILKILEISMLKIRKVHAKCINLYNILPKALQNCHDKQK